MTSDRDLPSPELLRAELIQRIVPLCQALLPQGRNDKTHWCVGSLAGEAGQSLKIQLGRGCAGQWKDFSSGESGDVLKLVRGVLQHQNWAETLSWCRSWLGMDGTLSAEERKRLERRAAQAAKRQQDDLQSRQEKKKKAARAIFFNSQEKIAGTPAECYLTSRAIQLPRWPHALRYHPALECRKTNHSGPALVASISTAAGQIIAIHRTWIEPDGAGGWRKVAALGRDAKQTLGSYGDAGAYIPVWRGRSRVAWADLRQQEAAETVYVTEGLEDALTLADVFPDVRIACAVSLSGMASVRFAGCVRTLVLCADNDTDPQAQRQLQRAADQHQQRGLQVRIFRPDKRYKDLNDWLRGCPRLGPA